ncbi:MAG: hypothetical protein HZB15_09970 [Actinobacteria bacterium]|nr:hypothetical protein [Actinomycetota bacterium]
MKRVRVCWVTLALLVAACGDTSDEPVVAPQLRSSPTYVNRVIPGRRPLALVAVEDHGGAALRAAIDLPGAEASVEPAELNDSGVAEVWVDLPPTDREQPFSVTVLADRQDAERAVTIAATAVPGTDDLASTATDIVTVFLHDLAGEAGLPAGPDGLTNGTPVAGLLVVSHYAWFTDQYEIGLSWHIMVAPDDFSELYLRPRNQLVPGRAWRIDSWSTALAGGTYTLGEIEPPAEVMR